MTKFRGQYMDMVHPSSDVHVANKANHADKQAAVKAPSPTVSSGPSIHDSLDNSPTEENEAPDFKKSNDYESPFLPNVEVEKRPLGGATPEGDDSAESTINDAHDIFDLNDFADFDELESPAKDQSPTEPAASSPADDEPVDSNVEPESETDMSEPEPEPAAKSTEVEIDDTRPVILPPEYKAATALKPTEPAAPFAHAATETELASTRQRTPIWAWIVIIILLIAAGVVIGALVYLSGWLS